MEPPDRAPAASLSVAADRRLFQKNHQTKLDTGGEYKGTKNGLGSTGQRYIYLGQARGRPMF